MQLRGSRTWYPRGLFIGLTARETPVTTYNFPENTDILYGDALQLL